MRNKEKLQAILLRETEEIKVLAGKKNDLLKEINDLPDLCDLREKIRNTVGIGASTELEREFNGVQRAMASLEERILRLSVKARKLVYQSVLYQTYPGDVELNEWRLKALDSLKQIYLGGEADVHGVFDEC